MNSTCTCSEISGQCVIEAYVKIALNLFNILPPKEVKAGEECPICLEDYLHGDFLVESCCYHLFHQRCAEDWRLKKSSCSICRKHNPVFQPYMAKIEIKGKVCDQGELPWRGNGTKCHFTKLKRPRDSFLSYVFLRVNQKCTIIDRTRDWDKCEHVIQSLGLIETTIIICLSFDFLHGGY